jgi:hypothetical protein
LHWSHVWAWHCWKYTHNVWTFVQHFSMNQDLVWFQKHVIMSHTPCFCIIEDCTEDSTLAHVGRVFDIVAYTMCFVSSINKLKRKVMSLWKRSLCLNQWVNSKANIDKMGFVGYITMKKIDQWQVKDYGNNGRIKK